MEPLSESRGPEQMPACRNRAAQTARSRQGTQVTPAPPLHSPAASAPAKKMRLTGHRQLDELPDSSSGSFQGQNVSPVRSAASGERQPALNNRWRAVRGGAGLISL